MWSAAAAFFPRLSANARPSPPTRTQHTHPPLTIVAVDGVVVAVVVVRGRRRRARGLEPGRVFVGEAGRLVWGEREAWLVCVRVVKVGGRGRRRAKKHASVNWPPTASARGRARTPPFLAPCSWRARLSAEAETLWWSCCDLGERRGRRRERGLSAAKKKQNEKFAVPSVLFAFSVFTPPPLVATPTPPPTSFPRHPQQLPPPQARNQSHCRPPPLPFASHS